jgi:AraC-like DNA-binding protein
MAESRTVPETAIVKMETAVIPIGYAEHAPPPDLAGQVVCFWTALADATTDMSPNRVLPDGCVDIILGFGSTDEPGSDDLREAFAVGAMTKPLVISGARPRLYIAVRFKPGFAFAALGVPAAEMTDDRVSFALLGCGAGADVALVAAQTSPERRLGAFVEFVRRRLFGRVARVPRSVRAAVHRIVSAGGNLRIESLASDIGVTRQGLAKQFATHVGLTPKTLARISRTRLALARADAARAAYPREIDWSAIAYDLGYYDQPHFIDEFKAITGRTPGEWIGG